MLNQTVSHAFNEYSLYLSVFVNAPNLQATNNFENKNRLDLPKEIYI